jgi:ribosomal protein S12 methylthiotransferase
MANKKIYLVSLGCAKNKVDSEMMLGQLKMDGWQITKHPDQAQTIVVNTCSFIEAAIDESIETILSLANYKKHGKCRRLIVAGCLPERFREELGRELPEVDYFLGTGGFDQIAATATAGHAVKRIQLPDPEMLEVPADGLYRVRSEGPMAYLKIAEGCHRRCTYCVIPRLRGKQKSRSIESLVAEAKRLVAAGTKELVLIAQESSAYAAEGKKEGQLTQLLERIAVLNAATWIRVLYLHPASVDDGLIDTMAVLPNVCSYFDIPIQHASDRMLKRMGREYTKAELYRLFARIRAKMPEAALRTTAMVGFPGETEADFKELLKFCGEIAFDHLGAFVYSDAKDLPAHGLKGHIDTETAQNRHDRIMAMQQEISQTKLQNYVGQNHPVLVEEQIEPGLYLGRTKFQAPEVDGVTYIHTKNADIGDVLMTRITDALEYDISGDAE